MNIQLPEHIREILSKIKNAGFEGYCVGGCVRDSILCREINDWDVTTSASPDELCEIFSAYRIIPTGLQHGTITVVCQGKNVEITTYRVDGEYTDNRHPENVSFTRSLSEDLSRRDFTVNAMCYNDDDGLVDMYGGIQDLENKIIRAVGDPDKRFNEDALRILRALRFSSQLGFKIEEKTEQAIFRNKELLKNISAERIAVELKKLLCGKNVYYVMSHFAEVFFVIIPELQCEYRHPQIGAKHAYDVWEHTCHTVDGIEADEILRLTMLLHDCGKVKTEAFDEKGNSTFKNHAAEGGKIANGILKNLKLDNRTIDLVTKLVSIHDMKVPTDKIAVKKYLSITGVENFHRMMKIRKADRGALSEGYNDISDLLEKAYVAFDEVMANNECYSQNMLCVSGSDLTKIGIQGKAVGECLTILLDAVITEKIPNNRAELLNYCKSVYEK